MIRSFAAIAALALACLLLRAARVGIDGDYLDPIGHITAQDEALYAHSAIRLARRGGWSVQEWLTPRFMGRYATYKPPMLVWLSGLAARISGVSRLALRFPSALLCSLTVGLIFLWAAELRGWLTGALAALLLMGNHMWNVTGAMCLTDGLLASFDTAAMYCLFYDPWLESRRAFWGFAAFVAAAILTKTVAGLVPLAVLALYWLAAPSKRRPTLARACAAGGLALALAAPWFLYEMSAHGRWFWTEHVQIELLGFGAGSPPQTSSETNALFYFKRLAVLDPFLLVLAVIALPGLVSQLRKRSADAILLFCWLSLVLAVLSWHYRNATYLMTALPPLALLAAMQKDRSQETKVRMWLALVEGSRAKNSGGVFSWAGRAGTPQFRRRSAGLVLAAVAAFALKCAFPDEPWGLSFHSGTIQKAAAPLSNYCSLARGNELIVVGMEDDLYASVLPLVKLRYAWVGPPVVPRYLGMDFRGMGITITAAQFDNLPAAMPVFRQRLHEWGLDSDEPAGTLILVATASELAGMIRSHPGSDFLVPRRYRAEVAGDTHVVWEAGPDYLVLLSKRRVERVGRPDWSCWM